MLGKTLREGFSLVELSFSLAFIGILSIVIVLIINNTVVAYRRGLVLSQLNSNGIELVDDMRAAVQGSSARSLRNSCATYESATDRLACESDGGRKLASVTKSEGVALDGPAMDLMPIYGAFCTGSYSYIWNSGYFEYEGANFTSKTEEKWAKLKYLDGASNEEKEIANSSSASDKPFRLLKVEDPMRAVCIAAMGDHYGEPIGGINNVIDIRGSGGINEPEEILSGSGGNTLAFYDLSISQPAEDANGRNAFYYVSFILGTVTGGINVNALGNSCVTPSDYESTASNLSYCAINKFNFAAQVNGG